MTRAGIGETIALFLCSARLNPLRLTEPDKLTSLIVSPWREILLAI